MSFTLIPPGKRKNNPFYLARGSHPVTGRDVEISTKTRDKATAREIAKEVWAGLGAGSPPRPGEAINFEQAAHLYADFKCLDLEAAKLPDERRLVKLIAQMGRNMLADINQATLVAAANQLYPQSAAATRNREALRPAAAILHYAAGCGYCSWLRVKLFKEQRPRTRAVSHDVAAQLIRAAPQGKKQLLLLWLFHHGTRITQTLSLTWENEISLVEQNFRFYDRKAAEWQTFPLHPEVFEELCRIPEMDRRGRLWPWRTKSGVYKWLRPLSAELGIAFTPHMGRHSLGTWLNAQGEGLRTIMAALGHKDPKSSIRYQTADVEMVRAATQKLGEFRGIAAPSRRKLSP